MAAPTINQQIPIHLVSARYLVHDADHVAHLRRNHNMTGVPIGGLPQAAQQNVFLGLPIELMPEEAALLVEKGAAYVIDDPAQHHSAFLASNLPTGEKQRFQALLNTKGQQVAEEQHEAARIRQDSALERIAANTGTDKDLPRRKKTGNGDMDNWNDMPEDMLAPRSRGPRPKSGSRRRGDERSASSSIGLSPQGSEAALRQGPPCGPPSGPPSGARTPVGEGDSTTADAQAPAAEPGQVDETSDNDTLFSGDTHTPSEFKRLPQRKPTTQYGITPTTSYPPLTAEPPSAVADQNQALAIPVPKSYPLYRFMNGQGYYLTPGLRFGCQYTAYAGDPLRYHSHFLCNGKDWHEEFSLMEIIAGGRLGTGVKKGFLLGGVESRGTDDNTASLGEAEDGPKVRAFVIEWSGM